MTDADAEIRAGQRFAFGANWSRFLESLTDERIEQAKMSLCNMLEVEDLRGLRFCDAGSGSGLFSLAARSLGAQLHSFDLDPKSVACTAELKRRYFPHDGAWTVERGSVLDPGYLGTLGKFDIVYSWGVLHHTGAMWQAMENMAPLVVSGGRLFVALYNDEGRRSRRWASLKRLYNERRWARPPLLAYGLISTWSRTIIRDSLRLRPLASWQGYFMERGMSPWWDLVDWIGGWPFEVATPDAVFLFYRDRGFTLRQLVTRQGLGCNEFVFIKT